MDTTDHEKSSHVSEEEKTTSQYSDEKTEQSKCENQSESSEVKRKEPGSQVKKQAPAVELEDVDDVTSSFPTYSASEQSSTRMKEKGKDVVVAAEKIKVDRRNSEVRTAHQYLIQRETDSSIGSYGERLDFSHHEDFHAINLLKIYRVYFFCIVAALLAHFRKLTRD